MTPGQILKVVVYALVLALSAIALTLVFISPREFTENKSVYQGF